MRARAILCLLLAAPQIRAESQLQQALALAREGHYLEARSALTGVAEPAEIGQRIAYRRLLAAIASGLHERQEAVKESRAALALAPSNSQLLLGAAATELEAGILDGALGHVTAATESAPRDALLGDIEEKRGEYAKAIAAYEAAVALAPSEERYIVALGLELIEHVQYQKAIDALRDAASRFPKSARIPTLLGIAEYGQGYSDEAANALEDAIARAPKGQAPYAALARIALESSSAPNPRTLKCLCPWDRLMCAALELRLARTTGDAGMQARATAELQTAPQTSAIGRCELARAYEWENALKKAREAMEQCVRLDPSPTNHYRLGLLYQRLGMTDLARQEMDQRQKLLQRMSEETEMSVKALEGLDTPPQGMRR